MKKRVIRLLCSSILILSLSMSFIFTLPINAEEHDNNTFNVTEDFAVFYESEEPLFNSNDDIIAYYYEGIENGYAIIGIDGEVIEYALEHRIDIYNNQDEKKSYYGGPLNYYVESSQSSSLVVAYMKENLISKKDICSIMIDSNMNKIHDIIKSISEGKALISQSEKHDEQSLSKYATMYSSTESYLPYDTRYFSYNNNGNCGSTAAAIMMFYYYDHIDSSYITNAYYRNEYNMVNHFKNIMNDNGNGTSYSQLKNGINTYLEEVNKSKSCSYVTIANIFNRPDTIIQSNIRAGEPCIIRLSDDPSYGNHWVVCIGYQIYTSATHYKVNNGYGNIVFVNGSYVDGVVYI